MKLPNAVYEEFNEMQSIYTSTGQDNWST